jgi:hypothetical protein
MAFLNNLIALIAACCCGSSCDCDSCDCDSCDCC